MILMDNHAIEPLTSAFENFQALLSSELSVNSQLEIVQAFNKCFDSSLGVLKTLLEEKSHTPYAPVDILTLAVREGFINELDLWITFLEKRALSEKSTVPSPKELEDILTIQPIFSVKIHGFLDKIWVKC